MNKDILHQSIALLSRREHTGKELIQKLMLRDYELADIQPVLAFLIDENYQSDIRAAQSITRKRISRGYGWLFIENELTQKGITADIISTIYQEQAIDWHQQVKLAYQKRFGDSEISSEKEKAKRIRFLEYRGFSIDEIMSVLTTNY